jgi:uncharacterized membrane protein
MIPSLINLLIYVIVLALLGGLVYWVADAVPLPQPFNRLLKMAVVVICVLIVILLLLQLVGAIPMTLPLR